MWTVCVVLVGTSARSLWTIWSESAFCQRKSRKAAVALCLCPTLLTAAATPSHTSGFVWSTSWCVLPGIFVILSSRNVLFFAHCVHSYSWWSQSLCSQEGGISSRQLLSVSLALGFTWARNTLGNYLKTPSMVPSTFLWMKPQDCIQNCGFNLKLYLKDFFLLLNIEHIWSHLGFFLISQQFWVTDWTKLSLNVVQH